MTEIPIHIRRHPEPIRTETDTPDFSPIGLFTLAQGSEDRLERLAYLQLTADKLRGEGKTIEDIGISVGNFVAVGNRSYNREGTNMTGIELNAINSIFSGIISSLPTRLIESLGPRK